jgi:hypothetical protein
MVFGLIAKETKIGRNAQLIGIITAPIGIDQFLNLQRRAYR